MTRRHPNEARIPRRSPLGGTPTPSASAAPPAPVQNLSATSAGPFAGIDQLTTEVEESIESLTVIRNALILMREDLAKESARLGALAATLGEQT